MRKRWFVITRSGDEYPFEWLREAVAFKRFIEGRNKIQFRCDAEDD